MVPKVSVNIRTYNSAKTLGETLESVKKQTYKNVETLVSDGFSKDDSVKIAKKYKARVNYADKLGDARYQNYKKSKGKYILSLDSDQILDNDLVKKCVELCEDQNLDAISISEKSKIGKNTLVERLIAYDKWLIDKNRDDDPLFGTACPRFFRKSILDKIGWMEHLAIFDDTILYSELLRNNAKVSYLSTTSIWHHEVDSWKVLASKFYRYGKGYVRAFKSDPKTIVVHSFPRRSYFSKAVLNKPLYFFGLILVYLVKVVAAGSGVIASFLK